MAVKLHSDEDIFRILSEIEINLNSETSTVKLSTCRAAGI